jgi:hypothetical protein
VNAPEPARVTDQLSVAFAIGPHYRFAARPAVRTALSLAADRARKEFPLYL